LSHIRKALKVEWACPPMQKATATEGTLNVCFIHCVSFQFCSKLRLLYKYCPCLLSKTDISGTNIILTLFFTHFERKS
jgi:hypothetical protein